MKIFEIYRTHPDIFVDLTIDQQQQILNEAGYIIKLIHPLTEFSITESKEYENILSFSGQPIRIPGYGSRRITYRGIGFTFFVDDA